MNIARFLDSFQPHVDSVSVVRAIGNQKPDNTLDAAKQRGCITGEYFNAERALEWEHVDNFAEARNWSFALAPDDCEWLMWADCDDLLTKTGAEFLERLRSGALDAKPALWAPYITDASGSFARRIRVIRRDAFKGWINAVHEDISIAEDTLGAWCPELQVIHMPENNKRSSVARNRRILEAVPENKRTGREWWFLMRECEVQQDIPKALESAVVATGRDDLGVEEKFVAYQCIGRWLRDVEEAERPLLEAVRLMPHRREGYAELAKLHLARGSADKAVAYAQSMEAQDEPAEPSWTHDASLFGWRAHDIKCLALAKAGYQRDSDAIRKAWAKRNKPRIAVGHPAGRGKRDAEVRDMWLSRAARPDLVAYCFGICESDAEVVEELKHYPHRMAQAVPPGYSSAVANYNAAARGCTESGAKIFVMAQSDVYPPHGWDEQIIRAFQPHMDQPRVLHVSDGFRKAGDPLMTIMCYNWRWWLGREWLLCPEYDGYWSDTEYSFRAYRDGVVVDARHIGFYHDHPAFTGAESDAVYMRQQNPEASARGRAIFEKRNPDAVAKGW